MQKHIGILTGALLLLVGPLLISIRTLTHYDDSIAADWRYYGSIVSTIGLSCLVIIALMILIKKLFFKSHYRK